MIHFAIGTKAQFIKVAPVMKRLTERGIPYRYIDLGQHPRTTKSLQEIFGLKEPDVSLAMNSSANVASLKTAFQWTTSLFWKSLRTRDQAMQRVFDGQPGLCVIHGDTVSTLLGLLAAKRAGLKILHLEAGLRSQSFWHPFPEEILRLVCMKYVDHLAAPSDWAFENLRKMGYAAKAIQTHGNTGAEAVVEMLHQQPAAEHETEPFALVSIHRFETIMSRSRLQALVNFVLECVAQIPVRFVLHEPTQHSLNRFGLLPVLRARRLKLTPLLDYPDFLRLIQTSQFVVTDGGSVQEECFALGKPCLLFRKRTERQEGLGENACLSKMDPATLRTFIRDYPSYRRPPADMKKRPSDVVIDFLVSEGYDGSESGKVAGKAKAKPPIIET